MTIASRTPEGLPSRCSLCGAEANVEYSAAGDAPCPQCGFLLWESHDLLTRFRAVLSRELSLPTEEVGPEFLLKLERDSVDLVELVMEIEDEFGVAIADDDYAGMRTVRDVVEYILRRRSEREAG